MKKSEAFDFGFFHFLSITKASKGIESPKGYKNLASYVFFYNPNCLGNQSVISGNNIIKIKARIIAKKKGSSGLITF